MTGNRIISYDTNAIR